MKHNQYLKTQSCLLQFFQYIFKNMLIYNLEIVQKIWELII